MKDYFTNFYELTNDGVEYVLVPFAHLVDDDPSIFKD